MAAAHATRMSLNSFLHVDAGRRPNGPSENAPARCDREYRNLFAESARTKLAESMNSPCTGFATRRTATAGRAEHHPQRRLKTKECAVPGYARSDTRTCARQSADHGAAERSKIRVFRCRFQGKPALDHVRVCRVVLLVEYPTDGLILAVGMRAGSMVFHVQAGLLVAHQRDPRLRYPATTATAWSDPESDAMGCADHLPARRYRATARALPEAN